MDTLLRRAYTTVAIMLMAPVRLLAPAACRDMMNTSTLDPACEPAKDSVGYTVHAVPHPSSVHADPMMSR